jgi:hypothetical protein
MINRPTESELLELANIKIDKEGPLEDRVIYIHLFLDGHSWYVSEYDPKRRRFFGYMIPKNDYLNARWDYFCYDELCRMQGEIHDEVVRNIDWEPKRAIKVDSIRDSYKWRKDLDKGLQKAKRKIARNK